MSELLETKELNDNSSGELRCLIIEDDQAMAMSFKKIFEDQEYQKIELAHDGKIGWEKAIELNPTVIILDWKLPEINGLGLLNRFRQDERFSNTPIIIVSGYLNREDFRLFEDFPLVAQMAKPFQVQLFQWKVKEIIKEADWMKKNITRLKNVLSFLEENKEGALKTFYELVDGSPKENMFYIMAAKVLFQNKQLDEAEDLLKKTLERDPESLSAMTLLGKIYLIQKKFSESSKILKQAITISPQNLERLCLMGDVSLNMLETDKAKKYFMQAAALDSQNEKALSGMKLTQNIDKYLSRSSITEIPQSFAGLLNAIGISMVKSNQHAEGMNHYQSAMLHCEDEMSKAKLAFNLGLGFLRWKKPDQALGWFSKSIELSDGKFDKAKNHFDKLEEKFSTSKKPSPSPQDEFTLADDDGFSDVFNQAVVAHQEFDEETVFKKTESTSKVEPPKIELVPEESESEKAFNQLQDEIPELATFMEKLEASGGHVGSATQKILKLKEKYSNDILQLSIKEALSREELSPENITFHAEIFKNKKPKRKLSNVG